MKIPLYLLLLIVIGGITSTGIAFAVQTFNDDVIILTPNKLGVGANNPQAQLHVLAPNLPSGSDAVRFDKPYDPTNSVRFTFNNLGGTPTDGTGGAFWRGLQFGSPTIVENSQNKFPRLTLYAEYDTLTDPTQKLWILSANQNHDIAFRSANTDLMKLKNTGEVGFGVSNPTEKLDVNGNIKLSGDILSNGDICIGNCQ